MVAVRFFQLAALLAPLVAASPAPPLARETASYPVEYQEWLGSSCAGSPGTTGSFEIGQCATLAEVGDQFRLTPRWPFGERFRGGVVRCGVLAMVLSGRAGSACTVQFWDAEGCAGTGSEVFNVTSGEESACIRAFGRGPPGTIWLVAVTARVLCSD
ncbi:hypothetical protein K488DRAFT_90128 [Vararia minispora EC-137]|uniref:Uncharacterized protein n=1 Tax=Vararia minispora EC-137 TaxID=1314806 RepID=A0ACB8Q8F9_9AGAM|nr:hypothetical protein K488DRAFT_90128 [Vararia minispora EC-137]